MDVTRRCLTVLPDRSGSPHRDASPAPRPTRAPAVPLVTAERARSGRSWLAVPTLAAILAVASAFATPSRAQWLVVAGGVLAVVAAAWPVLGRRRRRRARQPHPLSLVSVGLWLTVAGEVLHATGAAYPSYADAIELAAYPLMILGLLRLVRARLRERPLDTLLVAAIAPTALGAFAWMPLVAAVSHWVPGAHAAAWMTVAFLAVDLLAVAMLARLTILFRGRPLSYQLLLAAFGALLGAHVSRTAATMTEVVPAPFGSQTLLLVAFGLLAAACLHPSLLPGSAGMRPRPAPIGRGHVLLLALAVTVGPLAVALQYAHVGEWVFFAIGAPALISLLVVAHLGRLVRERGRLEHESTHDLLTGLPNRAHFHEALVRALTCTARPRFAVGFVDLDRFKKVNDSLGHDAGDDLLRQVARRLQRHVRGGDTVARLAGDEFAILLPEVRDESGALAVARQVLEGFATEFAVAGHQLFITPSIGIALAPQHGEDAELLLKNADRAMYEAKSRGRNTIELYTPRLDADSHQQLSVETRLHTGIGNGELVVHYQPKVSLRTGEVTGVEALVRWQHPTIGLVPPAAFMRLAEETGLVASIGEQVLLTACTQVQAWRRTGFPDLTVSVNLSIRQFQLQDVASVVAAALEASGLPPHALELELTESAELGQARLVGDVLEQLRAVGVRCSIDDFGTGYTGIAYLNDLPVDKIKLDKTFIDSIGVDGDDAPFVRAMIAMAHSLGLEVVAEGVETAAQALFLREQGCDTMQGYLFSRPLPADDLRALLISVAPGPDDAAVLQIPAQRTGGVVYGEATDARALGDLLWNEEQQQQPVLRLAGAAEDDDQEAVPITLARRTLVLTSAAGVMAVPLLLGLGSAGALPPEIQKAVSTAFERVGATPVAPPHSTAAGPTWPQAHGAGHPHVVAAGEHLTARPDHPAAMPHPAKSGHPGGSATAAEPAAPAVPAGPGSPALPAVPAVPAVPSAGPAAGPAVPSPGPVAPAATPGGKPATHPGNAGGTKKGKGAGQPGGPANPGGVKGGSATGGGKGGSATGGTPTASPPAPPAPPVHPTAAPGPAPTHTNGNAGGNGKGPGKP